MPLPFLVAIGGALGALARYGVNVLVEGRFPQSGWYATVVVNLVGCACIGFLYARTDDPQARALLGVGALGGFTTFSTFGSDALGLIAQGRALVAGGYLVGSVGFGVLGVWLGRLVAGLFG